MESTKILQSVAERLLDQYLTVRRDSTRLIQQLTAEDCGLQAMPDVSPPKWHLAHTTWFFETFLLKPFLDGYQAFHPQYEYLFNSYYNTVGQQYPRAQRGLLSRPSLEDVLAYRQAVDVSMVDLLSQSDHPQRQEVLQRHALGLNHEQQHQELLCTDIKYSLFQNPLYPAIADAPGPSIADVDQPLTFSEYVMSDAVIGASEAGFHFDNEAPIHAVHLHPFQLANRLVSNAEFLHFIEDGGYTNPSWWLSDGWAWKQEKAAAHPLYWLPDESSWQTYTLYGLQPLNPAAPVIHVNYYESDAYARWAGYRLPTEFEWEAACRQRSVLPAETPIRLHPVPTAPAEELVQMFGTAWQWTQSPYAPYPRYRPAAGAIGEYNGKFMCNQMVLRGSSCVTPTGHARPSYRNFFYPKDRWQVTGIRLAADLDEHPGGAHAGAS